LSCQLSFGCQLQDDICAHCNRNTTDNFCGEVTTQ
jgi:hypothetical protein